MHDYGLIHPENLQTWASAQELSGTFMVDPSTLLGVPYASPWLGIVTIIKKDINNAYGLYIFNYHDNYCCMSNAGKWTEPWVKLTPNKYPSNPNLLDNWYFGNPANQRGLKLYTDIGYTIDRWKLDINPGEGIRVNDGYITLNTSGIYFGQYFDNLQNFKGKTFTGTILCTDGNLYSGTFIYNAIINQGQTFFPSVNGSPGMYIQQLSDTLAQVEINTLTDNVSIIAVKLELGDTQTLAHQDSSGNWILNEIPDFGDQLRRCMYYAEKIEDGNTPVITNATFIPAGATSATFVLPYERKRTYPSIRFNAVSNYRVIVRSMSGNTSAFGISNISILDVGTTKASVLVTFSSATSQDWYGYLQRSDNTTGGYAFISADL